jgi:IPT/TIG domain
MYVSRPNLRGPLRALLFASLVLAVPACDGGGGATGSDPNPVPTLNGVDPEVVAPGSPAFTLTVTGTNFVKGSVVRWADADRPTTFVSSTQLTAQIASVDVANYGEKIITVANPAPGGGASNAMLVVVGVFGANITALEPDSLMVDVGGSVTVTGTGIVPGSYVEVGTNHLKVPSFYVSPTEIRFTLAPENVPLAGEVWVQVLRPDGVPSSPLTLTLVNPPPVVASLSPAQVPVEQPGMVLHVTGSGMVRTTLAYINGSPRTAQRVSATQLDVDLTAQDLAAPGTRELKLYNPWPGGGTVILPLEVVTPAPVVSAVSPSQAEAGRDSLVVRLTGSGFVSGTVVRFNGSARPTRRIDATQLEAVLTAADLQDGGTFALTAVNPAPGGGTSAPVPLTLVAPVPAITSLPSNGATAGGPGYTLVVHGTGFVPSSRVRWNGVERTTRFVSNRRVETTVGAGDVATPRTVSVSVSTPGAGTSGVETITVRAPGSAALTGTRVVELPAADIVYSPQHNRVYAALGAAAGARTNTVVAIDPNTGDVTGSVEVGGAPNALAVSDDGSTLWVAVGAQVRRLALPSLTAGTSFSSGFVEIGQMAAMPGHAGTLAITPGWGSGDLITEWVAIYDDGARRPHGAQGSFGHSIAFGEEGAVVYGLDVETSARAFRTAEVRSDGGTTTRVTEHTLFNSADDRIQFAGGRVYGMSGDVVDGERHQRVGTIPDAWGQTSMAVDAALGRIWFFDSSFGHGLRVFDLNTFQLLGSAQVDGVRSQHPVRSTERLLRWGSDGLVLSDGQAIHILRTALAGP